MPPENREPTDAERAALRQQLDAMRAELRHLIADETGLTGTVHLDQSAMGRVSRNDALQQQEMAKATRRKQELRLARVEAAIERYDDDPEEYGFCPDCGETIGIGRLRAFPETVFCVSCMEARGG